ncbi:hypothetical protein JV46_25510 [Solemya velum gill symbiont]|uniref:Uncharacterized protein n=1 Tax=Solemya velum gill symbiont TaxID=2340 RepID=A0A0B0H2S7_SOVGS|nr:hypothetical protein JV46_25510 [Solemya velum gill symbiont]
MIDRGLSKKAAYRQLSEQKRWAQFVSEKSGTYHGPDKAESLKSQYNKFRKNRWSKVMLDAYQWHVHSGTIETWEQLIDKLVV